MQIQKLYCPECGYQLDGAYCAVCRRNLVPEAARPNAEPVRCSAWIEALAESWERTSEVQMKRAEETPPLLANGHYNQGIAFSICARELRRRAQEASASIVLVSDGADKNKS